MDDIDRAALVGFFNRRLDASIAGDTAMAAYWAGRIDGHCLQNAIDGHALTQVAHEGGFHVGWPSVLFADGVQA